MCTSCKQFTPKITGGRLIRIFACLIIFCWNRRVVPLHLRDQTLWIRGFFLLELHLNLHDFPLNPPQGIWLGFKVLVNAFLHHWTMIFPVWIAEIMQYMHLYLVMLMEYS